ncbi:MAG: hypothetical protein Q7J84_00015 [Sulfuricaulis sp.]|nr:hypothetical protein [Sulfuricaulis sp.]
MNFHDGLNLILLLLGLFVFYRLVKSAEQLEFWHLISVTSADGKIWTDNDKVGQMTGLVFGTWIVCWLALTNELTVYYFGVWLIYAAGMTAFAKWARAFVTDRFGKAPAVREPDPPPPSTTTTTTTKTVP